MQLHLDDTIAALGSAAGAAARGIIRLSGSDVCRVIERFFTPVTDECPSFSASTSQRYSGTLRIDGFRTPVPADIYLWPNARSYTGQPAAELHLPGSPPLLEAVLAAVYAHGARPAQPGEFTMRAFLAGRIDLVQAEAVLGVIDADDRPRLQRALKQLAGGISGQVDAVRNDLLNLLADLEAGLDFVEEDIEFVSREELLQRIIAARDLLEGVLQQAAGRMLSTGRRSVVIAGLPNAGKSTLFNALTERESALVSDVSGTTRDYLAAECDWNGTAIQIIDTAGWEHSTDDLSAEAQLQRARQLERADLILWCAAAELSVEENELDRSMREQVTGSPCPVMDVRTKMDVLDDRSPKFADRSVIKTPDSRSEPRVCSAIEVSATAGTGMTRLKDCAVAELARDVTEGQELVGTTAARCRESFEHAIAALGRAHDVAVSGAGDEMIAVDLHESLEHLGRIVGAVYSDDILDRIFSRFCIGK